jgi:hypothetical protein
MRIVIETDEPDEGQGTTRVAATERVAVVLDGGPAPAALLRQFGRIPEAQAETAAAEAVVERTPESEGGEMAPNPLRHGESVATQRQSGGRARARDVPAEDGDDVPAEDPSGGG